jgi:hypothetical protein
VSARTGAQRWLEHDGEADVRADRNGGATYAAPPKTELKLARAWPRVAVRAIGIS